MDFSQKTKIAEKYFVGFSIVFGQIMKCRPYTKEKMV
jgi:hypothetical protein